MKWINRAREPVETVEALDTFVSFVIWQISESLLGLFEGFLAKIEEVCYLKTLFWGMKQHKNIYIYGVKSTLCIGTFNHLCPKIR